MSEEPVDAMDCDLRNELGVFQDANLLLFLSPASSSLSGAEGAMLTLLVLVGNAAVDGCSAGLVEMTF